MAVVPPFSPIEKSEPDSRERMSIPWPDGSIWAKSEAGEPLSVLSRSWTVRSPLVSIV